MAVRDVTTAPAGLLPIRTGLVANRGRMADRVLVAEQWCRGRMWFQFTADVINPTFIWGNWYVPTTGGEVAGSGALDMTAAIETAAGVITSSVAGSCAAGANLSITIPGSYKRGTWYALRYWAHFASGMVYRICHPAFGAPTGTPRNDTFDYKSTVLSDNTAGGAYSGDGSSPHLGFWPAAIVAPTRQRGLALIGDSRISGDQGDIYSRVDYREPYGRYERALMDAGIPFTNFGRASEKAADYITAGSRRTALAALYATDIINGYGINDIRGGSPASAATAFARLETINANFPAPLRVWQCTLETVTSGTWLTVDGQTVDASNATRLTLNTSIRASLKTAGVIDISKMAEDETVADKFRVLPGPVAMTADGIHVASAGEAYLATLLPVTEWKT